MDEIVEAALRKWPNVPHCYGWLGLDARGNWYLRDERAQAAGAFPAVKGSLIEHEKLRDFIARNYAHDAAGCWYFQNGPQRVYVSLAYTPLVVHYEGEALLDHCARPFSPEDLFQDEEGSVLIQGQGSIALLDDRDLERMVERADALSRIARAEVAGRFRFVAEPRP